ncbi:MAG: phage tail protein [Acidobacteriota bacterium]
MARDIRIQLNRADVEELNALMSALDPASRIKALVRAMNKTARGVRTDISREIRAKVNIKAKDVTQGIKVRFANKNEVAARITISGKRRPLMLFGARQVRAGVTVQVYKDKGRKLIKHAFIRTVNGRENVFWRAMGANGKRVGRTPIVMRFGLALPEMFAWTSQEAVEAQARERLKKNLTHEIDYLLQESRKAAADANLESNDT